MIPLWQRYFFKELVKIFLFFLFGFFALYALLDYATHMEDFFSKDSLQIKDLLSFYANHFLKRSDLLLPLSLLIATIKVLTTLNLRREWMALQVAGVRTRELLYPFFTLALIVTLFNWANFEYFLPKALSELELFHVDHFKSSHRAKRKELIHLLSLKDSSKLVYQGYNEEKDALFDVLWVRSVDDIWRMKYLSSDPNNPDAEYVDHLVRGKSGLLEQVSSHQKLRLSALKWNPRQGEKSFTPFENRSIRELYRLAVHVTATTPYEMPKIVTQVTFKCLVPLLPFLIVLAVTPYCITFTRSLNPFTLYALGLFGLLSFYMILDGAVILGEHAIFSPLLAILTPFILFTTLFGGNFIRKTS